MSARPWIIAMAVFASSCATFHASMTWQSRRLVFKGSMPRMFLVVARGPDGPAEVNLSSVKPTLGDGAYSLPTGYRPPTTGDGLREAARRLTDRRSVDVLIYSEGPPQRASIRFNHNDNTYWSEYEFTNDGRVRPIASRSVVKAMAVVAAFHALLAAMLTSLLAGAWIAWRSGRTVRRNVDG